MPRVAALVLLLLVPGCGERARAPAEPTPDRAQRQPAQWRVYSSLPSEDELRDVRLAAMLAFERHAPRGVEHVALSSQRPDVGGTWEVGRVIDNARRAAADPRTMAYVGEAASGASATSMPILGEAGVAQVAPGGTYAGLTRAEGAEEGEPAAYRAQRGRHFARVVPADHLQAQAAVRWMRALGTRRLMTVGDGESNGNGVAAMVASRAAAAGIEVTEDAYEVRRLASIRDLAERVERLGVDTLYFGGIWQNRAPAVWGRVHRAAPHVRLIGGDGVFDRAFTEAIFRSARQRTFIVSTQAPPPAAFARAFRERFGHRPHPLAVYGHEAMRRALKAVAGAAGSRRGVIDALFARSGLDRHGDVTRGRFGGYRVSREGELRLARTLVVSAG